MRGRYVADPTGLAALDSDRGAISAYVKEPAA
jgi:hypothetical protein